MLWIKRNLCAEKKKNHITRCLQKGGVPVTQQYYQRPKFFFAFHTVKYNIDLPGCKMADTAPNIASSQSNIQRPEQEKKHCSSLCLFMRWENFHRALLPPDFLSFARMMSHAHLWTSCWPWKQNSMNGLKYSGFTLPIQWGGGEGLYSLKVMATGYPTKPEIDWWIKKRKVAIR